MTRPSAIPVGPAERDAMHPEYPSQAAISAGVAVGILESVFGPQPTTTITATDFIDPKLTRQFSSVSQMGEEHNNVRIWGGIHFRNTLVVATEMGRNRRLPGRQLAQADTLTVVIKPSAGLSAGGSTCRARPRRAGGHARADEVIQ
jgi:hypothetical protein